MSTTRPKQPIPQDPVLRRLHFRSAAAKEAALAQAATKEVYLTDDGLAAKLPEGMPEQVQAAQDLHVTPGASGCVRHLPIRAHGQADDGQL